MLQIHETGELIRALRKQKDLTQEQLAGYANIDVATLSKIENGHTMPKQATFRRLLEVLRFDTGNAAHLFLSKEEIKHVEIIDEGKRLFEECEKKDWVDADAIADVVNFLDNLAQNEDFLKEPKNKQVYLQWRASVNRGFAWQEELTYNKADITVEENKKLKENFAYSPQVLRGLEEGIEMLYEALRLTIPSFEIEKISEYYLTSMELALISCLANMYGDYDDTEKDEKCISIYKELVKPKGKNEAFGDSYYPKFVTNLVVHLMSLERFEEAIQYANEGTEYCLANDNNAILPFLSGVKAYSMGNAYGINEDGDDEEKARAKEVKELYRYAYYYALLANNQSLVETCWGNFTLWFKENIDGTPLE